MTKRDFLKQLLGIAAVLPFTGQSGATTAVSAPMRRIALQISPVAGFQYHQGKTVWPQLTVGDGLQLQREPGNPHDGRAVKVLWRGRQLGYVPRVENTAIAYLMDSGKFVTASIAQLQTSRNPWQRIHMQVELAESNHNEYIAVSNEDGKGCPVLTNKPLVLN
jgi:hypothetical protein